MIPCAIADVSMLVSSMQGDNTVTGTRLLRLTLKSGDPILHYNTKMDIHAYAKLHSPRVQAREQFIHRPAQHTHAPPTSYSFTFPAFLTYITQVRTLRTDRILFHECERAKGAKAGAGLRLSLPSSERVLPRAGKALKDVLNLGRTPALAPARPSPVSAHFG